MDNTTKTTIMRTLASNVVVIEQRDVNNNIAHFSSNQYMSHQNNKKGDNDHIWNNSFVFCDNRYWGRYILFDEGDMFFPLWWSWFGEGCVGNFYTIFVLVMFIGEWLAWSHNVLRYKWHICHIINFVYGFLANMFKVLNGICCFLENLQLNSCGWRE